MRSAYFSTAVITVRSTRRGRFLSEMERVLPWDDLLSMIQPHYLANDDACSLPHIECMLRIYLLQQWFNLSESAMVDELHDSRSMLLFSGIGARDTVPDEAAMRRFRRVLKDNRLFSKLLSQVNRTLRQRGLLVKNGAILDATIMIEPAALDLPNAADGQRIYVASDR